jgi:hypothetical protein
MESPRGVSWRFVAKGADAMSKWRLIKLGGGQASVQVIPQKCRERGCPLYCRTAPGAVYCLEHRWKENAGCAAHDKVGCKAEECR